MTISYNKDSLQRRIYKEVETDYFKEYKSRSVNNDFIRVNKSLGFIFPIDGRASLVSLQLTQSLDKVNVYFQDRVGVRTRLGVFDITEPPKEEVQEEETPKVEEEVAEKPEAKKKVVRRRKTNTKPETPSK